MISSIRRRLVAVRLVAPVFLAGVLAVSLAAPLAYAAPPPPSATTTMSVSGCDFAVTYDWQGFKGRHTVSVRLVEVTGTPLDLAFAFFEVGPASGKSSPVTHTFHLTAGTHAGRSVYARASLLKSGTEVSGSRDDSTTVFSTCGEPIT